MKYLFRILVVGLFYSSMSNAQTFNSKYFETSKWASNNKDSLFFKADTIKLIKLFGESKDIASYFEGNNFITLEFKKHKKLKLFTTQVDSWSVSSKRGKYKWGFNKKNRTLNLYFNNKLFASFIPSSEREVEIRSNYIGKPIEKTIELALQRSLFSVQDAQ